MKTRSVFVGFLVLLTFGSASFAEETRPYLGVSLDPTALPELLVKHLRLEPGQGIRITNIMLGSAADEAGLERDDIIVAFQGTAVMGVEPFVDAVRGASVGAEVSLEVIHLGRRKELQIELRPRGEANEWKYPPEPQVMTSWRPGKVFKMGPDGREWIEVPSNSMPEFDVDVESFFQEVYTFQHTMDGEAYTITIEGDPDDKNSRVVVRAGDREYTATVGQLDQLPEKYQGPAKEDIENARGTVTKDVVTTRRFRFPKPPRPDVHEFFESIPRPDMERWSEQKDLALEKLEEQMERLQQQMRNLEQRNREMLDRLLEKREGKKDTEPEPQESASPASRQKQAI